MTLLWSTWLQQEHTRVQFLPSSHCSEKNPCKVSSTKVTTLTSKQCLHVMDLSTRQPQMTETGIPESRIHRSKKMTSSNTRKLHCIEFACKSKKPIKGPQTSLLLKRVFSASWNSCNSYLYWRLLGYKNLNKCVPYFNPKHPESKLAVNCHFFKVISNLPTICQVDTEQVRNAIESWVSTSGSKLYDIYAKVILVRPL